MKNNQIIKAILLANLISFLFAVNAVLVKLINIAPQFTAFYRVAIIVILLGLVLKFSGEKKIGIKNIKKYPALVLTGILLGIHWITYFYSIHISNVAIGSIAIYTFPFFTVFLEPLIFRRQISLTEVFSAILVLVGIFVITPEWNFENNISLGIFIGLISAFTFALRNVLTKKLFEKISDMHTMFWQAIGSGIVLLPFGLQSEAYIMQWMDFIYIIALGLISASSHTLFVKTQNLIKSSTLSILMSTEVVYAALMEVIIFSVYPTMNTLIGGCIILGAVVMKSLKE